ncbi:glycosyltransferase [Solirubrobacter ginsenosidimutans]|uniref:Glycosyltransferase n=1 Tax=Solirubrobacter ginsenosidimutans TaxID=490573 RepID=A0A9X3MP24_9ACTN|nr:glycosyltransferase [Solirubrobacter ginsenosidimutans]MDA0160009.1 glycosyltransferase [Solirubrobacter ginsenosidimutans]
MKVLLHSNAPWSPSGYGQQVALFAPRLAGRVELSLSAFHGLQGGRLRWHDIDVLPSVGGTYGDESILGHAESVFGALRGGLVLTLLDVPALDPQLWRALDVACWLPVDHDPAPPSVGAFLAQTAAIPIAMSRFGQDRLAGFDPLYVPHGIDTTLFHAREGARERVGLPASAFVVGAVAMNKGVPSRKSLPQIVEAFAAFRARHGEALLYLHTEVTGHYNEGYDLRPLLAAFGLGEDAVVLADQYHYRFDPLPAEHLVDLYSSFDVLLNPAMGEGFGLPILEAQACGVPAIVTDFTAMSEVCGAGWKVGYDRVRTPMRSWQAWPKVDELVDSLEACYALPEADRRALGARAREHALHYDVDTVFERDWLPALDAIEQRIADRAPIRIPARAA